MYSIDGKRRFTRPRFSWSRLFLFGFLAIILFLAGSFYWVRSNLKAPLESADEVHLVVGDGDTVASIADNLERQNVVRSALVFRGYMRFKHPTSTIPAGEYKFDRTEDVQGVISKMISGDVEGNLITFVPGARISEIQSSLINSGYSAAEADAALDPAKYLDNPLAGHLPNNLNTLEGLLFPDSYARLDSTPANAVVGQAMQELNDALTAEMLAKFRAQGLSAYQAITLASVIEEEVSSDEDRKKVAQVFYKRLDLDMPLQSDVTAKYGAHLDGKPESVAYDSKYSTRKNKGLPPSPISTVSRSSLDAVANPAGTDYLYFVSGDDGRTHFSKTLAEHERLTKEYCTRLCN